jgi:hypothetical protein
MITYAALSHALSVVFDRCLYMLEITRLVMDFSAAAMWLGDSTKFSRKRS